MKIIVAIIVFNRLENIKRWVRCWKECKTDNAELIVIHTGPDQDKFREVCKDVTYIHRANRGFDIGAFQDVCRGRLEGFPKDWDYLLWITDDTLPMTHDFITPFIAPFSNPHIGCTAMQISSSVADHVRTTGFCIKQDVAARLQFPADPVITKEHCYFFEHRGGNKTMTKQIRLMKLDCVQVAPNSKSPLWDSGYWKRLNRLHEHEAVFPPPVKSSGDRVTFICTIFNTIPQIISSLLLQNHKNWELILIHDGPSEIDLKSHIPNDPRIKYIETPERNGKWGHPLRQMALKDFDLGDYVVITNADNYYVPVFVDYMLRGFKKSHTAVATYCDKMIHSYIAWDVMLTRLQKGYLDCGGVMVKAEVAKEIGWRDVDDHSADWIYFSDIATKYSWRNFIPVKGALFVHN